MTNIICSNCGKENHVQRDCRDPLTSYGLICIYDFNEDTTSVKNSSNHKPDNKVVMIRRKDTIGYVEFLRGKYNVENDEYILTLFNTMTIKEKERLLHMQDFDKLRVHLGMTKKNYIYKNEYDTAKLKFNKLLNIKYNESEKIVNKLESLLNKSVNNWEHTEWGLPKGRKHQKESNINCAIREFLEETGILKEDINVLINVKPLEETYTSFNNIKYNHIYYLAKFNNNKNTKLFFNLQNKNQVNEISAINWFTEQNAVSAIRPYYTEKKNIITQTFNILNEIDNNCSIIEL
jgi:ADP-ribose pyrophosphatase YjhB (NUDIX family)